MFLCRKRATCIILGVGGFLYETSACAVKKIYLVGGLEFLYMLIGEIPLSYQLFCTQVD